jgi:anaerobic magnesium-protoporphyrin IX monomethyl ester cyclase
MLWRLLFRRNGPDSKGPLRSTDNRKDAYGMKIRLIEPNSPSRHLWSKSYFVRLGLPMIGAALVKAGHDVRIFNPQMAPIDWPDVYSADLVGISSTTSTIPESYRIADDLRRRGIPVVIGGSHVTFMADEALRHADYVARGEGGETIMVELAEALQGARGLDSVTGISYIGEDGTAVHAPLHDRCPDLDLLPFPDLTLIHGHERITPTPIMTSWGCPFDCTFCSVTAMFGKKYRFRSAENVIAELKEKEPRRIFFYDDNFAANKKRLKRLLRMMIDEGITVPWGAQVRTDVVRDPELMELMRASGAEFVALGLESVNQATLDHFEKSQTVGDIEHAIKVLHDYGIRSHGMFVLGADHDTPDSLRDTVRFAIKNRIDTVMLNILTPLPGTRQFDELDEEGRIIERDWSFYDAQHVVFRPRQMTPIYLLNETLRANRRFYATWRPVLAFHRWLWGTHSDKSVEEANWGRMLEYGWLWYYSRMWWTNAKNRAQRRRLRALSKGRPPMAYPAAPSVVTEVCTTAAEAGGAETHIACADEQRV